MGKVLKAANVAATDSFASKALGDHDEVWITLSVAYESAALGLWTTDPTGATTYSGDFVTVFSDIGGGDHAVLGVFLDGEAPGPEWWYYGSGGGGPSSASTGASTWHLVEVHYLRNTLVEVFIDSASLGTGVPLNEPFIRLTVGQFNEAPLDPAAAAYIDNVKVGTTRGASDLFADDFEGGDLSLWDTTTGEVSVIDDPIVPPEPPAPASGHRYRWRYVVTDLGLATQTFLDGLATARKITYTMNKAAVAVGTVPSDSPEVNIAHVDGNPFVEEGIRFLLAFRQEGGTPRWQIRFAGIIMQLEDNVDDAQGAAPYTNITAYDPWQYLYARPVRKASGDLLGPAGLVYAATPANQIVTELLSRTQDPGNDGNAFIDPDAGTIEVCDPIDITFQQGTTVGEAWDQLCQSGFVDIILTPLYAPSDGNPATTKIAALNVYASPRARIRRKAIFAWDKPSRSLAGLNRLKDGTQRANRILYHTGQGGKGVGTVSDGASQAKYGDYWAEQFFPGDTVAVALEQLANEELLLRKDGVTTYRVNPVVGSLGQIDSPVLFFDYFLGDQVPVYASKRFRRKVDALQRVYEIPVEIRDDGMEQISQMTFSKDGLGG